VSSRPHTQPEEEDPADKGTEEKMRKEVAEKETDEYFNII
jgi:hypothetical protein